METSNGNFKIESNLRIETSVYHFSICSTMKPQQ